MCRPPTLLLFSSVLNIHRIRCQPCFARIRNSACTHFSLLFSLLFSVCFSLSLFCLLLSAPPCLSFFVFSPCLSVAVAPLPLHVYTKKTPSVFRRIEPQPTSRIGRFGFRKSSECSPRRYTINIRLCQVYTSGRTSDWLRYVDTIGVVSRYPKTGSLLKA